MRKHQAFRKPYRIKKRKAIFRSRAFWITLLILILSGILIYFVVFSQKFWVKSIRISGNQKVDTSEIESLVKEKINRQLFSFHSQSIFLSDTDDISESLLIKFPQIEKAKIKEEFPDVLLVEITERVPAGVWCYNEDCFSIDKSGVIFEKSIPEATKWVIRSDNADPLLFPGKKVIDEKIMDSISKIERKLDTDIKVGAKEFVVFNNERINVKTLEGWEIYFSQSGNIDWQLTKLKLVLEKEIPLERRKELEYIELRFGNLAPYRYRTPANVE